MRIVCLSDTHGKEEQIKIPFGDILIHCGDFSMRGSENEFREFASWFNAQPHQYKLCCPGNHDWLAQRNMELAKEIFKPSQLLHNEGIEINGVKFWLSASTPWFYDWAFNFRRGADIAKEWNLIPDDADVLITHGPPNGILDEVERWPEVYENVGCEELRKKVDQMPNLKLSIFGHLHLRGGQSMKLGNTTFANVASVNEDYKVVNEPFIFDI